MSLRFGNHLANAGSVLSLLLLSATVNSQLEIQATGEDEDAAIQAAEVFFQSNDEGLAQQAQVKASPGDSLINSS